MLEAKVFKEIVRHTNLFAIDLMLRDGFSKVLLCLRKNKPAKGFWFVPGGRVYKNETLQAAFQRILGMETGLEWRDCSNFKIKGLYDHIYPDNYFNDVTFNTHYIVCCIEAKIDNFDKFRLDEQHREFNFLSEIDILARSDVHGFTKNYFINEPFNKFNLL